MKRKNRTILLFSLFFAGVLAACSTTMPTLEIPTPETFPSVTPTASTTSTISKPTAVLDAKTATALPSPTPTPRTHVVKKGETLGGIAWQYGVSLDALIEMNADVNVYAMSVGTALLVPYETVTPGDKTPVPTPVQLTVDGLNCQVGADAGIWCFVLVKNTTATVFESISVNVNIAALDADQVYANKGFGPVNLLRPGETMPVAVYFPPVMPNPFQTSVQFAGAVPLDDPGSRYLPVTVSDTKVLIAADGLSATVMGTFMMEEPGQHVRVAAAAYDETGRLVGLRRWQKENPDLQSGDFSFQVYSVNGKINRVELLVEAQK